MKKLVVPFFGLIIATGFFACQKPVDGNSGNVLESSSTTAKQAEPILFKMNNAPENSIIKWNVTPNENVQINVGGSAYSREAAILFGSAGKYTVSASAGSATSSTLVTIDTTIYPGPADTTGIMLLTHDSLTLTPSSVGTADSSGLVIAAITRNKYDCMNNFLISKLYKYGNDYTIVYSGVLIPKKCQGGQSKAQSMMHINDINDGIHILKINLDNQVYTGSFTKTGNKYVFTWPYNDNVVKITPLVIQ